jgi:hypothetical protein
MFIVVGAAILFSGCMTTRVYDAAPARRHPDALSQMCGGLVGKEVAITTIDGFRNVGRLMSITTESVEYLEISTTRRQLVSLDSIQSIVKAGSTSGSLIGLALGGVAGGIAGGAIMGASEEHKSDLEAAVLSPFETAATVAGALIGFGIGGGLGAAIGTAVTAEEIYTFGSVGPVRDTLRLSPQDIIQETATTITVRTGQMEITLLKSGIQIFRGPEKITIIGPRRLLGPLAP